MPICPRQQALENMRARGKVQKIWQICRKLGTLTVRQEIASTAGVGARNVGNVMTILKNAHPRLITVLLNGTLSINGAMRLCKLPRAEQLEPFIRQSEDREINKVIRRSVSRPK